VRAVDQLVQREDIRRRLVLPRRCRLPHRSQSDDLVGSSHVLAGPDTICPSSSARLRRAGNVLVGHVKQSTRQDDSGQVRRVLSTTRRPAHHTADGAQCWRAGSRRNTNGTLGELRSRQTATRGLASSAVRKDKQQWRRRIDRTRTGADRHETTTSGYDGRNDIWNGVGRQFDVTRGLSNYDIAGTGLISNWAYN